METADILFGVFLVIASFSLFPLSAAIANPPERAALITSLAIYVTALVCLFSGLIFSTIVASATGTVWFLIARRIAAIVRDSSEV